jgi:hypothetical protein
MRKTELGILAAALLLIVGALALSQPPDRKDTKQGPPRGGPGGGPGAGQGFELGRVLPPHVREQLTLTPQQERALSELEREVAQRLSKILTSDQVKQVQGMRRPEPPRGGPGGPPGKGPGMPPDKGPIEPRSEQQTRESKPTAGGIQWFATWESGLKEAERTGRPILLVSAAPHCAGVSGIW